VFVRTRRFAKDSAGPAVLKQMAVQKV